MGKWLKRILLIVIAGVFLFSVGTILLKQHQDRETEKEYAAAEDQFVTVRKQPSGGTGTDEPSLGQGGAPAPAPIIVDFEALHAVNEDVIGWIYCEDTAISYPVLHGKNDDQYLRHLFDGSYSIAGSIFIEAENRPDFSDANTIIYGHNMRNGTMFGGLANWKDQAYYDAHPSLWLLTPEQDYRVDILGGYYTSAYSDTYLTFQEDSPEFQTYLSNVLAQSVIRTQAQPEEGARYVLLSTCADSDLINEARFVLHGKLVPVDSGK